MKLWTVLLGSSIGGSFCMAEYRTVVARDPRLVLYSPAGLVLRLNGDFWIAPGLR